MRTAFLFAISHHRRSHNAPSRSYGGHRIEVQRIHTRYRLRLGVFALDVHDRRIGNEVCAAEATLDGLLEKLMPRSYDPTDHILPWRSCDLEAASIMVSDAYVMKWVRF